MLLFVSEYGKAEKGGALEGGYNMGPGTVPTRSLRLSGGSTNGGGASVPVGGGSPRAYGLPEVDVESSSEVLSTELE